MYGESLNSLMVKVKPCRVVKYDEKDKTYLLVPPNTDDCFWVHQDFVDVIPGAGLARTLAYDLMQKDLFDAEVRKEKEKLKNQKKHLKLWDRLWPYKLVRKDV